MVLWEKNYGSLEKKYSTMEKSLLLHRKLWNFDLQWENLGACTMEKL